VIKTPNSWHPLAVLSVYVIPETIQLKKNQNGRVEQVQQYESHMLSQEDSSNNKYVPELSVASASVLILKHCIELLIVFPVMCTSETVVSEATDPIEIPCPPEHLLFRKIMLEPLLTARQSSFGINFGQMEFLPLRTKSINLP